MGERAEKKCPKCSKELVYTSSKTQLVCTAKDCDYAERVQELVTPVAAAGPPAFKKKEVVVSGDKVIVNGPPVAGNSAIVPPSVTLLNPLSQDEPLHSEDIGKSKPKKLSKEDQQAALERVVKEVAPAIEAVTGMKVVAGDGIELALKRAPKVDARTEFERMTTAFIDGAVARVSTAFVALYLSSRNPAADSLEAVAALEACRAAFDACGLILADVDTKRPPRAKLSAMQPKAKGESKKVAPLPKISKKGKKGKK